MKQLCFEFDLRIDDAREANAGRGVETEADINMPVSWLCVDCGFNTAPGMSTRAEIYQALIAEGREEVEQEINAQSEVYTVRDAVWARAGMHSPLCHGQPSLN